MADVTSIEVHHLAHDELRLVKELERQVSCQVIHLTGMELAANPAGAQVLRSHVDYMHDSSIIKCLIVSKLSVCNRCHRQPYILALVARDSSTQDLLGLLAL